MRTEQKQIGEYEYEVSTLGAFEAARVLLDVLKVLAPGFNSVDDISIEALMEQDVSSLLANVSKMVMAADYDTMKGLMVAMAKQTQVKSATGSQQLSRILDVHFSGDMPGLLKWFGFALGVNFGGFLEGNVADALGSKG